MEDAIPASPDREDAQIRGLSAESRPQTWLRGWEFPVSRGRVLTIKALAVATFTGIAVLIVAVTGLLIGAALFGLRSLVLLSGDTVGILDAPD